MRAGSREFQKSPMPEGCEIDQASARLQGAVHLFQSVLQIVDVLQNLYGHDGIECGAWIWQRKRACGLKLHMGMSRTVHPRSLQLLLTQIDSACATTWSYDFSELAKEQPTPQPMSSMASPVLASRTDSIAARLAQYSCVREAACWSSAKLLSYSTGRLPQELQAKERKSTAQRVPVTRNWGVTAR